MKDIKPQKYNVGQIWEAKGLNKEVLAMDKYDIKLRVCNLMTHYCKTVNQPRSSFVNWCSRYNATQIK